MKTFGTNYRVATQWFNNSFIMCNHIAQIDNSIFDNLEFDACDEDGNYIDIYQWFLTDCNKSEMEYLRDTFGLKFTYSDLLDVYVLCVDHFGTCWDYVYCETTNENAARELGEKK